MRFVEKRCGSGVAQPMKPVVMGPGSRFAWPGRQS
jgi:hypothetical protein